MDGGDLTKFPRTIDPDHVSNIDDDEDDLAVIAGDASGSKYGPAKVSVAPPKRLAGASFAPNGSLVRFAIPRPSQASQAAHLKYQDFRGISDLLQSSFDRELSDTHHREDDDIGEAFPFDKLKRFPWPSYKFPNGPGVAETVATNDEIGADQHAFQVTASKRQSVLHVHHLNDLLPGSADLAKAYTLAGAPYDVCGHNRDVCDRLGFEEHARAWVSSLEPVWRSLSKVLI